jgi:hypothetical protein
MISHRNFLATAEATLEVQRIPEGSVVVSWLPSAHVGERLGGYVIAIVQGWEIVKVYPDYALSGASRFRPAFEGVTTFPSAGERLRIERHAVERADDLVAAGSGDLDEHDAAHRQRILVVAKDDRIAEDFPARLQPFHP